MQGATIDDALNEIVGPMGIWQIVLITILALSFSSNIVMTVFFNSSPQHRCRAEPELESWIKNNSDIWTFEEAAKLIGPYSNTNMKIQGCQSYNINANTSGMNALIIIEKYRNAAINKDATQSCSYGHVYEFNEFQYHGGIVQEWNLVCNRAWQVPFNESAYMAGMLIGYVLGGWLSDRIGRRKTIIMTGFVEILANSAVCFSQNHASYVFFRVLVSIFSTARGSAYIVLSAEITTARYRSILSCFGNIMQILEQCMLVGILAYFIKDWRILNAYNILPNFIILTFPFILTESPKWLAARGESEKAAVTLFYAYRCNKRWENLFSRGQNRKTLMNRDEFMQKLEVGPTASSTAHEHDNLLRNRYTSAEGNSDFAIWKLFNRSLIKSTILSIIMLTFQITTIFGMVFYANNIRQHVSLVTIINSLAHIPGAVLAALLYRIFIFRKKPLVAIYICTALFLIIAATHTIAFQPKTDVVLNILSNLSIFFLSAAQRMLFIYVPELYRPLYRNRGFGIAAGLARIGALSFPVINRLDSEIRHGLPLFIYGCLILIQLIVLIFMEDTNGKAKPSIILQPPNIAGELEEKIRNSKLTE